MKLIKILSILFVLVSFSSCGDGFDDAKCAKLVRKTYPNKRIFIESPHYKYLVIDSCGDISRVVISGNTLQIDRIEDFVEIK